MARIVFDLDGTLVDSAPDVRSVANALLAERGLPEVSLPQIHSFIGLGLGVLITRLRAARDIPETEQRPMEADFLARYEAAVGLTKLYPHVRETLIALEAGGHLLGLCTNKPLAPALALLKHLGLKQHFSKIIAGDSLALRKPDPAPLLAAFEMGGAGPNYYVGDSVTDAQCAKAAGVDFLLFTEGYPGEGLADLPQRGSFSDFRALSDLII